MSQVFAYIVFNIVIFYLSSFTTLYYNNLLAPMSILPQHIPKQALHKMATGNSPTIHVPLLGPSVRHLLDSYGLDRQSIKPSGHKGQLLKGDVLQYIREHGKTKIKFTQILKGESTSAAFQISQSRIPKLNFI